MPCVDAFSETINEAIKEIIERGVYCTYSSDEAETLYHAGYDRKVFGLAYILTMPKE